MASTHSASSFNKDLNARVREALGRTEILALSTLGPDGPWTSPVQFRFNLELFFLSMREAKHVQNITQDARVSVAIYSYPVLPDLGIWVTGVFPATTGAGILSLAMLHVVAGACAVAILYRLGLRSE
jgi:hypothetical protein